MSKREEYNTLLNSFKVYDFPGNELVNPHSLDTRFKDFNVINPWERWHGDLDAEIMFIGQDFSDLKYFSKIFDHGNKWEADRTEKELQNLFSLLNIGNIGLPEQTEQTEQLHLFFTNAVLGIKQGTKSESIKANWYQQTAKDYTEKLINIIQPAHIIVMGEYAYRMMRFVYPQLENFSTMPEVIGNNLKREKLLIGKKQTSLFAVAHCSPLGLSNRPREKQVEDWKSIYNRMSSLASA